MFRPYLLTEPEEKILTEKAVSGVSAWSRLYEEVLGAHPRRPRRRGRAGRARDRRWRSSTRADRDVRRGAAEAVTEALQPTIRTRTSIFNTILVDKWIDDRLRGYPTWITSRNLANETSDDAVQALIDAATSRYDVPQRYYRLKAKLLGLDRLEHYDRFAPVADDASKTSWDEARRVVVDAYSELLGRGRRGGRAVLRRQLDRRSGAARQAPRRLLRDERARRPPVRVHELHGRPPLDPHARARARPRPARLAGAAARALQRLDAADDGRDRIGVRRGAHVQAAARGRGRPAQAARPAHRAARGRDRDDVPADRDEPLREPRPTPSGASRASSRPTGSASSGSSASRSCSATRSASTATTPGGATSRTSWARPATSTRMPTAICSRSRSSARTSGRATRSSAPYLDLLRAGGSKSPEELASMVGLDLTDPSIWASGIEAHRGRPRRGGGARDRDRARLITTVCL